MRSLRRHSPRPRHRVGGLQKELRRLLKSVANAILAAHFEVWATDGDRIVPRPSVPGPGAARTAPNRSCSAPLGLALPGRLCASSLETHQLLSRLDRIGRHTGVKLYVPEHARLLFQPAYSPQLPPAEHLRPLATTAFANRHFVTIRDLKDTQSARCLALQRQPDRIRSATLSRL